MTNTISAGKIDMGGLLAKLRKIGVEGEKEIARVLVSGAMEIEAEAKRTILRDQKTGVEYQRRTVTHRASAPGESPANDTGRLASSIHTRVMNKGESVQIVAGGGAVNYAASLEFGTRNMEARPFMKPSLDKKREFIKKRAAYGLKKAIEKVSSGN